MKKEDILRKRNLQLVQEVEDLKTELEQLKETNASLETNILVEHIENIKNELYYSIGEVNKLREEYQSLIDEIKEYRDTLKNN